MKRFSIGGQVVNTKGDGIANVKILLDGQEKAVSNGKGFYKLHKVDFSNKR